MKIYHAEYELDCGYLGDFTADVYYNRHRSDYSVNSVLKVTIMQDRVDVTEFLSSELLDTLKRHLQNMPIDDEDDA